MFDFVYLVIDFVSEEYGKLSLIFKMLWALEYKTQPNIQVKTPTLFIWDTVLVEGRVNLM